VAVSLRRLGDDSNALLLLRVLRRARSSGQLQHSRLLTLTEICEQPSCPTSAPTEHVEVDNSRFQFNGEREDLAP
jgi:hypothetical protein